MPGACGGILTAKALGYDGNRLAASRLDRPAVDHGWMIDCVTVKGRAWLWLERAKEMILKLQLLPIGSMPDWQATGFRIIGKM